MARPKGAPQHPENRGRPKNGPARRPSPRADNGARNGAAQQPSPRRLQHPLPNPPHWNTRKSPPSSPRRQYGNNLPRERSPFRFGMPSQPSYNRSREPRGPGRNGPRYADGDRRDFSFRSDYQAPRFPPQERRDGANRPPPRNYDRPRNHERYPRAADRKTTHNRPIIRALNDGEKTPERLAGMTDAPTRFRAAQDIPNSDNEDEEMGDDEVPTKRRKVDAPSAVAVATKWSNPDPYTTLPPVDENRAKRTDVVQLIRKAKLGTAGAASSSNGIAENNDFVPLDFGSDGSDDEDDRNEYPFDASNGTSGIPFDAPLAQPASRSRPDSKKRKRSAPIPGGVVENWVPLSASQATPWLTVDHSATERMGFWLHKEICDFHNFIRPTESEELVRRGLLKRVQTCLERFKTGRLYCFGSFAAGLYLPNSDMDLVYVSRPFEEQGIPMYSNKSMLFGCLRRLESSGIVRRGTGVCIHKAKVPIIKFIDDLTGIKVDISFENLTGVVANGTYEKWKSEYPAMVYLTPIVKQFLMMRDLNEVFTGGLGGFSISCLVISFLQLHPAIQSGTIVAERHLGELLVDFLDLYGNKFNMDATGITLNPPGYFPKIPSGPHGPAMAKADRWTIIDPNLKTNDISAGTRQARLIEKKFRDACSALKGRMQQLERLDIDARKGQSILGCLLGGNYAAVSSQRARLNDIFVRTMATQDGARE